MEFIIRRLMENHRIVEASAGDIILRKFIYLYAESDIYEDISKYYDRDLSGYYIEWTYTYNILTNQTDSTDYSHADMIDNLPPIARNSFKNSRGVRGMDDYSPILGVYQYVSDKPDEIPQSVYNLLRSKFESKK